MLWWKRGSRPYIKGFLNTFTTKSLIFQEITVWRLMIILCFSSILTRCYWMLRLSLALARIPSYIQQLQSSKNSAEVSFSSTYSQPWILSPLIHQCSSLSSLASFMTFFFFYLGVTELIHLAYRPRAPQPASGTAQHANAITKCLSSQTPSFPTPQETNFFTALLSCNQSEIVIRPQNSLLKL